MIASDVIKKAKATDRIADRVAAEMADVDLGDHRENGRGRLLYLDAMGNPGKTGKLDKPTFTVV